MPPKTKKIIDPGQDVVGIADDLAKVFAELGVTDLVKLADNMVNSNVECYSTGFPQLDVILHPTRKGLPLGRDCEVYSRDPEVGKTSLALEFIKSWQRLGKVPVIIDVENTITEEYLADGMGILTRPDKSRPWMSPVWIAGHGEMLSAEEVLELTYKLSNSPKIDILVIDSVAGLESKATLDKDLDENEAMGGIAKLLGRFCRKNKNKHAAVVWINQMRTSSIGGYNPTGQVRYSTPGGRALPFFTSIRLELSLLEKIKNPSNENECLGFKTKVYTSKNKVSAPYKSTALTYIFGDGFSPIYDYIDFGLKSGAIQKKGSWLNIEIDKFQGVPKLYEALRDNEGLFTTLKTMINGEDVADEAPGADQPTEDYEEQAA